MVRKRFLAVSRRLVLDMLLLELEQLSHDFGKSLWADSLTVPIEQLIDLHDLFIDVRLLNQHLHDLDHVFKFKGTRFILVIRLDDLLHLIVSVDLAEAAEQVLQLTCGDRAVAIFVEEVEGLSILIHLLFGDVLLCFTVHFSFYLLE